MDLTMLDIGLIQLACIVENDADRISMSRPDATDAMPKVYAIHPTDTLHRPLVNCENYRVTLLKRNHFGPRLHARPLFGDHKFAAGEIPPRL